MPQRERTKPQINWKDRVKESEVQLSVKQVVFFAIYFFLKGQKKQEKI